MVILATPNFATWLEHGNGFVDQVLREATSRIPWSPERVHEIDVVCACVDGLSPGKSLSG